MENEHHIDFWMSESDGGLYEAMNKGIDLATGDWVYFLGADDTLNDVLGDVAARMMRRRTVYYGDVLWTTRNRIYDGPFTWHKLIQKNISHQAIFYPRSLFDQYRFIPRYRICADHDLNLRAWGERKFRFEYMPLVICQFNDTGLSQSSTDEPFKSDYESIVGRSFGRRIAVRRTIRALFLALRRLVPAGGRTSPRRPMP